MEDIIEAEVADKDSGAKLVWLFALKVITNPLRAWLYFYYWVKATILRGIVGPEALAYVLHDSLFPVTVLKLGGAKVGGDVRVHRWLTLHETQGTFHNLEIGDGVFIGKNVLIDLSDHVRIGNRSGLGMNTTIITHSNFGRSILSKVHSPSTAPVEIMDDCGIGWGCIINKGTIMNNRVILLPGTVVAGTLSEDCKYGGNPARRISPAWNKSPAA